MAKAIILNENQFGEMMAYHGSGANFDKFNHKKYLNSGAGSQAFGWGTYVTNDKAIANGYSNVVGNCIEQIKPIVEEAVKKYGYNGSFSIDEVCVDINSTFKVYRGDLVNLINFYEEKLKNPGSLEHVIDKDYVKILLYVAKRMPKKSAYLYEVEIPDDNGFNYLSWYDKPANEQQKEIKDGLAKFEKRFKQKVLAVNLNRIEDIKYNVEYVDFKTFYRGLSKIFDLIALNFDNKKGDKAASLFLMQCGFDGIKYPAGTRWQKPDGASEDAYNYVIFDANKVKIINKTKV